MLSLTDEQKLHAFDAIYNNSFEGHAILDSKGVFLDANKQFYKMLKVSPGEIIGRSYLEITSWKSKSLSEKNTQLVFDGNLDAVVIPNQYEFAEKNPIDVVLMVRRIPSSANGDLEIFFSSIIKADLKRGFNIRFKPVKAIVDFVLKYGKIFSAIGLIIAAAAAKLIALF